MDSSPSRFVPFIAILVGLLLLPLLCFRKRAEVVAPEPERRLGGAAPLALEWDPSNPRTTLTLPQIQHYVKVRRRARQLRDDRITAGKPEGDLLGDAAQELGENAAEMKWVKTRIETTLVPKEHWNAIEMADFTALQDARADLLSIGIVVPNDYPLPNEGTDSYSKPE